MINSSKIPKADACSIKMWSVKSRTLKQKKRGQGDSKTKIDAFAFNIISISGCDAYNSAILILAPNAPDINPVLPCSIRLIFFRKSVTLLG